MKKYEFTGDQYTSKDGEGYYHTMKQIKAVRNFGNVKSGDIGGYIEEESCLSHDGDCWVGPHVQVYSSAVVEGNAVITCDGTTTPSECVLFRTISYSKIYENAHLHNASVYGDPWMNDIEIYGNAQITGGSIHNSAQVYGDAKVTDSYIEHKTKICGSTIVINSEVNTNKTYTEGVIKNTRIYE